MKRSFYLLFIFLGGCASQQKATTDAAPSVANLQSHVQFLASDQLQGRRTGTQGEALAADYIPRWAKGIEAQIGDGPFMGGARPAVADIKIHRERP